MIRRLIDASLDNRAAVVVLWAIVVALGWRSLQGLPIDAVPDVTNVQVQVLTNSPGLAPQEVERFITFPVEVSLSGLPAVEEVRSVSKFGLSVVTVVFAEGTDLYWARQLVNERLVEAREQVPEGYGEPSMGPISTGLGEIYQFEVRGEGYTPMELRTLLDWTIAVPLRSVPGVVELNAFGGELKTYQVTLDPQALIAYEIPLERVFAAIQANNRNVGGGYIAHAGEQYLIRGEGLVGSLEDLGSVVVGRDASGAPVYVRNLGEVEFAPMIRQGAVTRDGRGEAVVGIVMMLLGGNARVVAADVQAAVDRLQQTLPEGVTIEPYYDRTELVDRTIHTVATNLLEGGALVVVVLLLLLGSLRGGLIVAASIPLSMLVAFVAMRWAGLSGNLMSLGAIDFGLIVDGSVVLIENVIHRLERARADEPRLEVVRRACHEVARPVVFAVGIIMIVYLPILGLRGVEGSMFRPMALTVVFALGGSLLCALTLMPVLATLLLRPGPTQTPGLLRLARRLYTPLLDATLRRPRRTAGAAAIVFLGSLCVVPFLGGEFIPRLDEGAIAMQTWRLPSVSLEQSNAISSAVEREVREAFPEVRTIVSRTGRAEIATDPMGVEISDTYLILEPPATWRFASKDALVRAIDTHLTERFPGVLFSYSQPIELRVSELLSGVRSDIGIKIYGDQLEPMKQVADRVVAAIRDVPGIEGAKAEQTIGLPTVRVRLRREAIARLGIDAERVLDVVETIGGKPLGVVLEGQRRFVLQARFADDVRDSLDALRELRVAGPPSPTGGPPSLIPLEQLAEITVETGPAQISRERISRRITVEADVRGRDLASAVADAQAAVAREVELPTGWTIEWGGQFENLQRATARLSLLVPLALALIFVLLYTAFGSLRLTWLIYLNVPLAITGGLLALALRGYPFSISAAVGFIALFGIAVLNGVVLTSATRDLRADGLAPFDAAQQAARSRLRPVLMTATTDLLGFLPMAVSVSAGAEVQRPLATVVIGGILSSTLLTLLVLPALLASLRDPTAPPTRATPPPASDGG